jgi:hypothetical protein
METKKYKLQGVCPLLMHNVQLVDPTNEWVKKIKEISGKRKKTDDDLQLLSKYEWFGGLYLDDNERIVMPGRCIEAALVEGAKKKRLGKTFKSSVFCFEDSKLEYKGSKDPKKLWEQGNNILRTPVNVQRNKVMRTRPFFQNWSLDCEISYLPEVVDEKDVDEAMNTAGMIVGLGDWRPRFGRFEVVE